MTSTENLLRDSDKSTGTFESGYLLDRNEVDENWQEQKEKPMGKEKNSNRNLGLENKGFEPDSEPVLDRGSKNKVRVYRTLSEDTSAGRKATRKPEHWLPDKRRHSYAGRPSSDAAKIAGAGSQNSISTRRRSSATEEDLRRRACLNSMRMRRVSSSSQHSLPEVETSVGEDVFYDDDFGSGDVKNGQELSAGERHKARGAKRREYTMGGVCKAVELENRILNEYSRRLSNALQERAVLEKELNTLRRGASVSRLPVNKKGENSSKIHFSNEKLNSVRRNKGRGNEDEKLSFEQLRKKQTEQTRRLPELPQSFSSDEYNLFEGISLEDERNLQQSPQQALDGNGLVYVEGKDRNYGFKAKMQPEKLYQRNLTKESHQRLEENDRNERFFLGETEKKRRERKLADLAADLWQKLLQGEKFHGDQERIANHSKASSETVATTERVRTRKGRRNDITQEFSSDEYQFFEKEPIASHSKASSESVVTGERVKTKTKKDKRKDITQDFSSGEYQFFEKELVASHRKASSESIVTEERIRTKKDKRSDITQGFSSGEYQFCEELYAKPELREKSQRGRVAKLAEETALSTLGQEELQSNMVEDPTLVRSDTEANSARKDAFRRNQRRPLRYKRGSIAAESLTGTARRSSSRLNDIEPDEDYQDLFYFIDAKQDESGAVQQGVTGVSKQGQTEKSNRVENMRPSSLGSQSTEVMSQNNSKWFDYMLPPGKRRGKRDVQREDLHVARSPQQEDARPENAPSLQEKLRYYQERKKQRAGDENSFDLADAYMAAQGTEEDQEKELRRQAAGKAAILRREASHLLWQAMNLERICDPNARVRHIFTPY